MRLLHKQLKSSSANNINMDASSGQRLTIDIANASAIGKVKTEEEIRCVFDDN